MFQNEMNQTLCQWTRMNEQTMAGNLIF